MMFRARWSQDIHLVGLTSHYVTQRGKIAEKRMCVAKRTHRYARHEGEKRDDFPDVRPGESYGEASKIVTHCMIQLVPYDLTILLLQAITMSG